MNECDIKIAQTVAEIGACYSVMVQLRSHVQAESFVEQIQSLMMYGYQLAYLDVGGKVVTIAGFKIGHNLYAGKRLYVEDLVTCEQERSKGYGDRMMYWLKNYARAQNCQVLHLDSGVQRFAAHRFYLKQRLDIVCHHFLINLDESQ